MASPRQKLLHLLAFAARPGAIDTCPAVVRRSLFLSRHIPPFSLSLLIAHYPPPTAHCSASPHPSPRTHSTRLRPARLQLSLAKQKPAGLTLRPAESSPRPIDRCLRCSCLSLVSTVRVLHQVPTNQVPTASLTTTTTHQHALRLATCGW
jgi:hypothetical protein